jgi:hypothetical protein
MKKTRFSEKIIYFLNYCGLASGKFIDGKMPRIKSKKINLCRF